MRPKVFIIDALITLVLGSIIFLTLRHFKIVNITYLPYSARAIMQGQNGRPQSLQTDTDTLNNNLSQQMYLDDQESLFKILKNKSLRSSSYMIVFEGRIDSINTEGGEDKYLRPYKIGLVIGVGNSGDKVSVFFPEREIHNLTVLDSQDNTISIKDLKKNDRIVLTIRTSAVFKYEYGLLEAVIKKQ